MLKVGDFLRYGRIPAGHEIGQLLLQARDVDLQAVLLVDEADFGADVLVHDAVTETGEVTFWQSCSDRRRSRDKSDDRSFPKVPR